MEFFEGLISFPGYHRNNGLAQLHARLTNQTHAIWLAPYLDHTCCFREALQDTRS